MEEVQKLSNPEDYYLWVVKTKWQDITQTECKLMVIIHNFLKILIRYPHKGGKEINTSIIIILS
jgi:hypothetical protein